MRQVNAFCNFLNFLQDPEEPMSQSPMSWDSLYYFMMNSCLNSNLVEGEKNQIIETQLEL